MLIWSDKQAVYVQNSECRLFNQPYSTGRLAVYEKSGSFGRSLAGAAGSKTSGDIDVSLL